MEGVKRKMVVGGQWHVKKAKGQWKDKKKGCEVAGGRGEGKKTRYEIAAGIWAQRGDALLIPPLPQGV